MTLSRIRYAAVPLIPAVVLLSAFVQEPDEHKPQRSQPTGVATGIPHAPVKDAKSRPITAGGFVDGAPVVFVDAAKKAGLDKFHHLSGTTKKETILETPGSGVAFLDYDNDGWL